MRENPFFNLFPLPPPAPLRTRPPYLSLSSRGAASPSLLPTLSLSLCLSLSLFLFLLFAFSLFLRHSIVGGPTNSFKRPLGGDPVFPSANVSLRVARISLVYESSLCGAFLRDENTSRNRWSHIQFDNRGYVCDSSCREQEI